MKHTFQWLQSSVVVFFIISLFDPLQTSDAYLNPSKIARKNLYNYLLSETRNLNSHTNSHPQLSNYIQNKYFLSRPVRRIGSEFLGKRSLTWLPTKLNEKENDIKENDNLVSLNGKHLYNINENDNFNGNLKYRSKTRNKRGINSFENRKIKSLFSFLLRNRDDYFGKRFGYNSKGKPYAPYGYNRDIVGSEFLGKRSVPSETGTSKIKGGEEGTDDDNDDDEKRPDYSNSASEDMEEVKRALGSEFLGKRALGSEFLGKRALGSEFLGKRALGSEFLGKRALGSEFLGKRALGSEFLGKRALGSEFLGKRALGSEFLGKRALGSEFLGKRVIGNEFLGKRALGSEFLGKRQPDETLTLQILENDLNKPLEENFGKRVLGNEFLGKRHEGLAILLNGNNEQESLSGEHQNYENFPQNMNFNTFQSLQSGNYSQLPQFQSSEIQEGSLRHLNNNNIYPLYNFNTPSKYYSIQT